MDVSRAIRIAVAALSIAALSVLLAAQAGQNTYDPASGKAPSKSQNSFLDFTLKRINPAGQDYGKCLEEGRALLLDESVRNGYFWSNLDHSRPSVFLTASSTPLISGTGSSPLNVRASSRASLMITFDGVSGSVSSS